MTRSIVSSTLATTSKELEVALDAAKSAGNKAFRDGNYKVACRFYDQYLVLAPDDIKVLGNRSMALLALGQSLEALGDAERSIELKSDWSKGYYRKGCALLALNQWGSACAAFKEGLTLNPDSHELKGKWLEAGNYAKLEKERRHAQISMQRRNVVFKLKQARMRDGSAARLHNLKQSMVAPEWDLDDFDWRPTFISSPHPTVGFNNPDALTECDALMIGYVRSVTELSRPKQAIFGLQDSVRLTFFSESIKEAIKDKPECHVLVVESGPGILALLAAQHGARKVTCVEQSQSMYRIAKETIQKNRDSYGNCHVEVVPVSLKHCFTSTDHYTNEVQEGQDQLLEPADVFVVDIFDHSIVGNGLWEILDHAARYLVNPDCIVLPSRINVKAMLMSYAVGDISEFDMSFLNKYLWHPHHARVNFNRLPFNTLSDPFHATTIHLQGHIFPSDDQTSDQSISSCSAAYYDIEATTEGVCNCIGMWFELCGPNYSMSIASYSIDSDQYGRSWAQSLQYIDPTFLKPGEKINIKLYRDPQHIQFHREPSPFQSRHATLPQWHFDMILDDRRNCAYQQAIKAAINAKKELGCKKVIVLDAGAGSGLLSMMAAREGASMVFAVEASPHIADLCEEVVIMNGFGNTIKVINKDVRHLSTAQNPDGTEAEMSEKADILIMEVFDSGLIGEGCFHIIQACKRKLLKPDATMIPIGATVFCQPIQFNRVSEIANCNMMHMNRFHWRPSYEGVDLKSAPHQWIPLAAPAMAFDFDFGDCDTNMEKAQCDTIFTIEADGVCNAVVFWFHLYLDEERKLSTDPNEDGIGATWQQAVQFIEEHRVSRGAQLGMKCCQDTYGMSFQVVGHEETSRTGVPLRDPAWETLYKRVEEFNTKLGQSVASSPLEFRRIAQSAIKIGASPHAFGVDPHYAADLCMRMLG